MDDLFAPTEEQKQATACIAFAALIQAHGKPISIPKAWVDALPENFTLTYYDEGDERFFFVQEGENYY